MAFWRQGGCCGQRVSLRRCRGRSAAHAVSLRVHRCRCRSLRRRAAHPLPPGQGHCRAALKSAVNTHESGAGGKGFPLLQSLRDVLKRFSKEAGFFFSGRALGLLDVGSNPGRRVWFRFQLLPLETAVNGGERSSRARCPAPRWGDVAL